MNPNYFRIAMPVLFLPFKLKANTTQWTPNLHAHVLFLPFKLKANTTNGHLTFMPMCCFCLSN